MKKLITFTFLLIGLTGFSQEETATEVTQSKKWAIKAGLMMTNVVSQNMDGFSGLESITASQGAISPYVGISGRFGKKFIFQPELILTYYKLDIAGGAFNNINSYYNTNTSVNYSGGVIKLSVPLLFKWKLSNKLNILSGITGSFSMINKDEGSIVKTSNDNLSSTSNTTVTSFKRGFSCSPEITLGLEYELNSNFYLETRFNFGLPFVRNWSDDAAIYESKNLVFRDRYSIHAGVGYYVF